MSEARLQGLLAIIIIIIIANSLFAVADGITDVSADVEASVLSAPAGFHDHCTCHSRWFLPTPHPSLLVHVMND